MPLIALLFSESRRASGAANERLAAPWALNAIALAAPLGLLWALNAQAFSSWWLRDDPCVLVQIQEHGIWRPFFSPISSLLIPLQTFSLGLDFSLFGLEPTAFYGHQLLSFSVLIVAGYGFLKAYLTASGSSLALSIFVLTAPAFAVAQQLMNRHYLEGLALALISLTLYRRSVDGGRYSLAILGAALYLLAAAAKEVFVPLVALLPFLAGSDRRRRWLHGLPFVLAAGVYGLWRLYMLGWSNSLSGYGDLGEEFRFAALLRAPTLLGLTRPWQAILGVAALAAATLAVARRFPTSRPGLGVGLAALAAPLVPVAAQLEPRHFLLGALAAGALLAAALEAPATFLDRFATARALAGTFLLLLTLASLTGSQFWRHLEATVAHHRSEGSFVLTDPGDGLLLTTVNHSQFLQCLAQLRREVLGQPDGPGFCGDPCFCSRHLPESRSWRYQDGRIATAEMVAAEDCDVDRPLAIELSHDREQNRISWTFGPYAQGVYEVLLISGVGAPGVSIPVALPRQGSTPYWLFEPLRLVVRYRSPEGWQTYSTVYTVKPDGEATSTP